MSDEEFNTLGNNILKWKYEYYKLGNPSVSDEQYDYQEWLYRQEATKRGIAKNELGEMIDGSFFIFVGYKG
jgi:NAD-dependent DNA ligase